MTRIQCQMLSEPMKFLRKTSAAAAGRRPLNPPVLAQNLGRRGGKNKDFGPRRWPHAP
jgi:hypothetical protein